MEASLLTFFSMGLGLGLLHAFDPDHLAAVGGLGAGQRSRKHYWRFSLHWSLGHGGVLILLALLFWVMGRPLAQQLSGPAEQLVPFILIAIGGVGLWRILHDGIVTHRTEKPVNTSGYVNRDDVSSNVTRRNTTHDRSALFIGMIHGTAGSAPLLALIPLTQINEPVIGLTYIFLFCAGVALAMSGLGGLLALGLKSIQLRFGVFYNILRIALVGFSIILGFMLMFFD